MDKEIAIALLFAAVLGVDMDLVGVESKRGEAEEFGGGESERIRV